LAFYLPDQPFIPLWSQDDAGVQCQYDLWERPDLTKIPEAIVITEVDPSLPQSLSESYSHWDSLGIISVELGRGRTRKYEIFRASCSQKMNNTPSVLPFARQPDANATKFK